MAGLPATGKSAVATALQTALGAVVLNKDAVRSVLFPAPVLDYSTAQDDVCMKAIYKATAVILRKLPRQAVIIDGRTFLRSYQIHDVLALADSLKITPNIIECVCEDDCCQGAVGMRSGPRSSSRWKSHLCSLSIAQSGGEADFGSATCPGHGQNLLGRVYKAFNCFPGRTILKSADRLTKISC